MTGYAWCALYLIGGLIVVVEPARHIGMEEPKRKVRLLGFSEPAINRMMAVSLVMVVLCWPAVLLRCIMQIGRRR